MKKLHLGCGPDKRQGYINCDIREEVNPDVLLDLTKKLPFDDDSIDEIYIENVLEHIPNYDFTIKEMWRVCKNEAKIKIKVPFYSYHNMMDDPEHINYFGYSTLRCYSKLFIINPYIVLFINHRTRILNKIINWKPYLYQRFFAWTLPASRIIYNLEVIKSIDQKTREQE